MVAVNSSAISDVSYSVTTWTMVVTFKNGRQYTYWDVPEIEHKGLIEAESVGRYYNTHIKGKYQNAGLEL